MSESRTHLKMQQFAWRTFCKAVFVPANNESQSETHLPTPPPPMPTRLNKEPKVVSQPLNQLQLDATASNLHTFQSQSPFVGIK